MFDSRFETFLADTDMARRLHYQIRYRVFCLDRRFEDPTKVNGDEERDHWDEQSLHFLVREKSTKQWVATMRMIQPQAKPFPIESLCKLSVRKDLTYWRHASCEISRLCMIKRYRGHQDLSRASTKVRELTPPSKWSSGITHKPEPEIMLGLFRAGLAYSREQGVKQWYFLVTPALARMIKRIGVPLVQLGPGIEHRGFRIPYVTDPEQGCDVATSRSPLIARMLEGDTPFYRRFSEISSTSSVALSASA